MDTPQHNSAPSDGHSLFRDLRARNERRRNMRQLHAERKQRIERVIEAARAHAHLSKPHRS